MPSGLENLTALTGLPIWLILIAITWSLIWKGLALWKSAKRNSPIWFVALLVVNTLGIFEILYYYLFSEIKLDNKKETKRKKNTKKRKKR